MRDIEERLIMMHQRAAEIKRQEDMSRLKVLGSLSGGLLVCLIIVLQQLQNMHHGIMIDQSTGSSLLDDSVGISGASSVIFSLSGDIGLNEAYEAVMFLKEAAGGEPDISFSVAYDESRKSFCEITVVAVR